MLYFIEASGEARPVLLNSFKTKLKFLVDTRIYHKIR